MPTILLASNNPELQILIFEPFIGWLVCFGHSKLPCSGTSVCYHGQVGQELQTIPQALEEEFTREATLDDSMKIIAVHLRLVFGGQESSLLAKIGLDVTFALIDDVSGYWALERDLQQILENVPASEDHLHCQMLWCTCSSPMGYRGCLTDWGACPSL